jgi:hypothetical protein
MYCRSLSALILLTSVLPALAQAPARADKPKVETFRGKVVAFADVFKQLGIEPDADAGPLLGFESEDGKKFVLVKDIGSRMFFTDKRLLNRPMQLQGRVVPGTPLLQLTQVQSLKDGKLHDVYYWCDVCAIRRSSLEKTGICECCGGPMELKEVPAGK